MRKTIEVMSFILGGIFIFFLITQLPRFFEYHHEYKFNDEELRTKALNLNIKPIPENFSQIPTSFNINVLEISSPKVALGKRLFNDPQLSLLGDISCASCHNIKEGGADSLPTAIGHNNQKNPNHLNTPTVLNTAFATAYFWNARAKTLEEQAGGPIEAHFEMNMDKKELIKRLSKDKSYIEAFYKAFNKTSNSLTFDNVKNALAAYEKTLLTRGSLDEFLEGNNEAISANAKKGFELFLTRGCKGCHAGSSFGGLSVERFPLRTWWNEWLNIKVRSNQDSIFPSFELVDRTFPFENIGGFKGKNNNRLFRVPILRNINKTSPYFHNGSIKELKDAVHIMGKYQLGIIFKEKELDYLVEFLKTLNGDVINFDYP